MFPLDLISLVFAFYYYFVRLNREQGDIIAFCFLPQRDLLSVDFKYRHFDFLFRVVDHEAPTTLAWEAMQTLSQDEDGKQLIAFTDKAGHVLMTADRDGELVAHNTVTLGGTGEPARNVFYFMMIPGQTITISGSSSYTIYNVGTDQPVSGTTLPTGNYRIVNTGSGELTLSFVISYGRLSYNFYNQLGQLIGKLAPEGVKKVHGTGINNYATKTDVPFMTLYEYDTQGRLIATQNAENGRTEFIYRRDGRIRFSRNALQLARGSYSYTNYDSYGRPVESGEYFPDGSGLQFNSDLTATPNAMRDILETGYPTGGLITGTKKDVCITKYDAAENTLSSWVSGYTQDAFYLGGAVSYTATL